MEPEITSTEPVAEVTPEVTATPMPEPVEVTASESVAEPVEPEAA